MRALLAVVGLSLLFAAPARADVTPEYFTMPAGLTGVGGGVAVGGDGAVYFGASGPDSNAPPLGRLDPALAVPGTAAGITAITTSARLAPNNYAAIRDVTYSPLHKLIWFTRSDGVVSRWDGSTLQEKQLDTPRGLWGIAPAADGGAWFAEYAADNSAQWRGGRIASVSPGLGVFEATNLAFQTGQLDEARYDPKPRGVATTAQGVPWFVEEDAGHGHRIGTWTGGAYTEYFPVCATPTANPCSGQSSGSSLEDVTIAPDGAVWFTNKLQRSVGRLIPGGDVTEYKLRDMDAAFLSAGTPLGITTSPDGTLWVAVQSSPFINTGANALVQINPANVTKTIYKTGAVMAPISVATDAKGNVWFSGGTSGPPAIGRLAVGGTTIVTPPVDGGGGSVTPITQPVAQQPTALTPAVTVKAQISDPRVKGTSITANQICVGPPQDKCSLIYLIQTREYITGFPGAKNSAKPKLTTIGTQKVTLSGGQTKKVTVKLNSKGVKLLKKLKKFKATLTVTQSLKGVKKPKQLLKKNVTFKKKQ